MSNTPAITGTSSAPSKETLAPKEVEGSKVAAKEAAPARPETCGEVAKTETAGKNVYEIA